VDCDHGQRLKGCLLMWTSGCLWLRAVLSILVLGMPSLATSAAASNESRPAPSILEIPFSLPLQGLYRETERIVPTRVGSWRQWRQRHGVDTRYQAWRGPLAFRLSGDTLTLQAHVRYRVQVRKELLGAVAVKADCGVDEAPRQAPADPQEARLLAAYTAVNVPYSPTIESPVFQ